MPEDKTKEDPTLVGELIAGRYFVARLVGRGGMGEVYEAEDRNVLNQSVAIKALSNVHATNHLLRFKEEARSQAALGDHPGICAVKDLVMGEDGKLKYIVQEYIEGETLAEYLARNKERYFSSEVQDTLLEIVIQMCETMNFAHTAPIKGREKLGVIHRDLKPDNVMLRVLGGKIVVIIVDFGISRVGEGAEATSAGDVFGTPLYASPQQLVGDPVDHRTDIFSMGMILYEMLTGEFFYPANTTIAGIVVYHMQHCKERLERIMDLEGRKIVRKCLEQNPDGRYQTMDELSKVLKGYDARRKKSRSQETAEVFMIEEGDLVEKSAKDSPLSSGKHRVSLIVPPKRKNAPELINIETQASNTTSRVLMIGGVLVGMLLIGLMIYAIVGSKKKSVNKEPKIAQAQVMEPSRRMEPMKAKVRQVKKRPRPIMKQVKPRKDPPTRLAVPEDPELTKDRDARKLFTQWKNWCEKHEKRRVATLWAYCVRSHAEKFFSTNRQHIGIGLKVQKLIRNNYCTSKNLRKNKSMKAECKRLSGFSKSLKSWGLQYMCRQKLEQLYKSGSTDKNQLDWKCRKTLWFLHPKTPHPKVVRVCQHSAKRRRKLSRKCRHIFKKYPQFLPKKSSK